MEVMVVAPLSDAGRALDGVTSIRRLLALDDLWTAALAGPVTDGDVPTLVGVGEEMIQILRRLQSEADFYQFVVDQDPSLFEDSVVRALAAVDEAMGLPVTAALQEEYGASGWASEIRASFKHLQQSGPIEDELAQKLALIRTGGTTPGDFPRWWKCAALLAAFGLAVGVTVLAPPIAPAIIAMQLGSECLGLAVALPGCQGEARVAPATG